MICRKATVAFPGAKFLSSRAQNRGFCALLPFETPVSGHFEHKIEVFVRFYPLKPSFSGVSSTKMAFLCQKRRYFPGFGSSRAQNRGFCALLASGTPVFGNFEHKIGVFVRGFCILAEIFEIGAVGRGAASGRVTTRRRGRQLATKQPSLGAARHLFINYYGYELFGIDNCCYYFSCNWTLSPYCD